MPHKPFSTWNTNELPEAEVWPVPFQISSVPVLVLLLFKFDCDGSMSEIPGEPYKGAKEPDASAVEVDPCREFIELSVLASMYHIGSLEKGVQCYDTQKKTGPYACACLMCQI